MSETMVGYHVREATAADAVAIYDRLIEKHRGQVDALGMGVDGLIRQVERSAVTMVGLVDRVPVCLGGVLPYGAAMVPCGETWMVITPELEHCRKAFLRLSKATVWRWMDRFYMLSDYVDVSDARTLRWLRWVGFRVVDTARSLDGRALVKVELRQWV